MGLPNGFKKNIKISPQKVGPERRQEILNDIADDGTYLPEGINYEDMDKAFIKYIEDEFDITVNGEKVPVLFLTIQRWAEFSKTWKFTDQNKDIKLPFISIVRKPDIQVGTNQAGLWNIPGRRTYSYIKVPTLKGGRHGVDMYKIPQPTSVNITYEVRLFCNRMSDLNILNSEMHLKYQSRQHYINVKGHPIPTTLETVGDESPIEDFESRRFYVQLFEILMMGYILNEKDFEVTPTFDRAVLLTELIEERVLPRFKTSKDGGNTVYEFIFKCETINDIRFTATQNIEFYAIADVKNLHCIDYYVNDIKVELPFTINSGDNVYFVIERETNNETKFKLIGKDE
jgi:hypothetical protein